MTPPGTTTAVDLDRLADAVSELATRATQPEVRAQLHALGGIIANVVLRPVDEAERASLEAELDRAVDGQDEARAIHAMRRLAALERARIRPVDFSAASRG